MSADLTIPVQVNFLAARAVFAATSYLGGRSGAASLASEADRIDAELQKMPSDPRCAAIVDMTGMLIKAMIRTATSTGDLAWRWTRAMSAIVPLVRDESDELRRTGAQRS